MNATYDMFPYEPAEKTQWRKGTSIHANFFLPWVELCNWDTSLQPWLLGEDCHGSWLCQCRRPATLVTSTSTKQDIAKGRGVVVAGLRCGTNPRVRDASPADTRGTTSRGGAAISRTAGLWLDTIGHILRLCGYALAFSQQVSLMEVPNIQAYTSPTIGRRWQNAYKTSVFQQADGMPTLSREGFFDGLR